MSKENHRNHFRGRGLTVIYRFLVKIKEDEALGLQMFVQM